MWSFNDYAPTRTTDFVGWFRFHNDPKVHKCNMHASEVYTGNWTKRLIEDLSEQDNRTSWGRGIPYDERRPSEFIGTEKFRGDHPWLQDCTVIKVTYKTFTLWLANSRDYPEFLGND